MIKIQQLKKSTMISSGLRTVHVINERTGSRPLNRVHCQRVNYCQRGDEQMEGESIGLPDADGWVQIDLAADCLQRFFQGKLLVAAYMQIKDQRQRINDAAYLYKSYDISKRWNRIN